MCLQAVEDVRFRIRHGIKQPFRCGFGGGSANLWAGLLAASLLGCGSATGPGDPGAYTFSIAPRSVTLAPGATFAPTVAFVNPDPPGTWVLSIASRNLCVAVQDLGVGGVDALRPGQAWVIFSEDYALPRAPAPSSLSAKLRDSLLVTVDTNPPLPVPLPFCSPT